MKPHTSRVPRKHVGSGTAVRKPATRCRLATAASLLVLALAACWSDDEIGTPRAGGRRTFGSLQCQRPPYRGHRVHLGRRGDGFAAHRRCPDRGGVHAAHIRVLRDVHRQGQGGRCPGRGGERTGFHQCSEPMTVLRRRLGPMVPAPLLARPESDILSSTPAGFSRDTCRGPGGPGNPRRPGRQFQSGLEGDAA